MKILITGNPTKGLAGSLSKIWPDATFISRSNGWDLTAEGKIEELASLALDFDIFINNSALWKFRQVLLLDTVYKAAKISARNLKIICLGSTTDRATKGSDWLYQQEKKALRSYCTSLNLMGVWSGGPQVSYISFGTLSNNKDKHPDRTCLDIDLAASYIKWLVDQPVGVSINEISIDPVQGISQQ
jgi:hypothetical protein